MRLNWICDLSAPHSPAARYSRSVVPALGRCAEVVLWTWGALPDPPPAGLAGARLLGSEVPWPDVNRAAVTFYVLGGAGAASMDVLALSRLHAGVVVVPPGAGAGELPGDGGAGEREGPRRRALGVVVHGRGAPERAGYGIATSLAVAPDPAPPRAEAESGSPDDVQLYAEHLVRFALGSRHRRFALAAQALADRAADGLAGWRLDRAGAEDLRPLARRILSLVEPPRSP